MTNTILFTRAFFKNYFCRSTVESRLPSCRGFITSTIPATIPNNIIIPPDISASPILITPVKIIL